MQGKAVFVNDFLSKYYFMGKYSSILEFVSSICFLIEQLPKLGNNEVGNKP